MAGPKKIVDQKNSSKNSNVHLSDDKCHMCGGNLPVEGDTYNLKKDHGDCIDKVLRMVLAGKSPQ